MKSAVFILLAAAAGACSSPPAQVDRSVDVKMVDTAFNPEAFNASAGETVTIRFTNDGAVVHEAFIGDAAAQEEHAREMESGGHMEGHNMESAGSLVLDPGKSGELTYTFDDSGEIIIGCHQPGHYAAGMKATVTVS